MHHFEFVLLPRPLAQCRQWCSALLAAGYGTLIHPTVVIAYQPQEQLFANLNRALATQYLIFTSQNAVEACAAWLLQLGKEQKAACHFYAMGMATAQSLQRLQINVQNINRLVGVQDSTALLADQDLVNLSGTELTMITGENGRETFAESMRSRGNTVHLLHCYRRLSAPLSSAYSKPQIWRLWQRLPLRVIIATSQDVICNLFTMIEQQGHAFLTSLSIICLSERIMQQALQLGFAQEKLILVNETSLQGVLSTLKSLKY